MNKVACPHCQRSVHDRAPACPYCGEKIYVEHPGDMERVRHQQLAMYREQSGGSLLKRFVRRILTPRD